MRVTKDIREYVTRIIHEYAQKKADALERPVGNAADVDKYRIWAGQRVKEFKRQAQDEAKAKLEELGLKLNYELAKKDWSYTRFLTNTGYDDTYDSYVAYRLQYHGINIDGIISHISDPEKEAYDKKYNEIMNGCTNRVQEILVGLEIGEVSKKELDTVLAPYKE